MIARLGTVVYGACILVALCVLAFNLAFIVPNDLREGTYTWIVLTAMAAGVWMFGRICEVRSPWLTASSVTATGSLGLST
jgi:hypothetical protein